METVALERASTTPHGDGGRDEDEGARWRAVARRFRELGAAGALALPNPGSGRTRERWARFTAWGEEDPALARLAEGHADALAILSEIDPDSDSGPADGALWGVWAAEPPGTGLTATRTGDGAWRLDGVKAYCSGARTLDRALVSAREGDERLLLRVDLDQPGVRASAESWPADAMKGSDTLDVRFEGVRAQPVGSAGAYLARPGFQHGGIGVAACWYGGARAVARTLHAAARQRDPGPHALAHLGAVVAELNALHAALDKAASEIDADPQDHAGLAALRSKAVRATAESTCREVIDRVGRALGAAPLAHDGEHARVVADLTVYLRQHHAERDHEALGRAVADREWSTW